MPGGIDVLLASDDDDRRLPIVVEVKSVDDVGAYLGLVQALTYASELITPHQRQRLARFYPDHFEHHADTLGPFADIWVVVERGKQDPEQAPTRELAQAFLQDTAVSALAAHRVPRARAGDPHARSRIGRQKRAATACNQPMTLHKPSATSSARNSSRSACCGLRRRDHSIAMTR